MRRSIDFFRDEVRNGFYISTPIKQAWEATLAVLDEIDRICVDNNIKYFADWGTFLGAVRHGGFIPWDDDLDICMLRDDYKKFRSIADEQLPSEFVIHDYERKEDHWLFLARVVNRGQMCFEDEYLKKNNNFPWLAGVDIFIKDYLYKDEGLELKRDKNVKHLIALGNLIVEDNPGDEVIDSALSEVEKQYNVKISRELTPREMGIQLYKLAEQEMSEVMPDTADNVGQIFPWVLKSGLRAGQDKQLYDRVVRLPFEDTTIPVPAEYNKVLASRYGHYLEIRKVWEGHDYPFYEGQREEMEELAGDVLPEFTFDKSMIERPEVDDNQSLKNTSLECMKGLEELVSQAERMLDGGTFEEYAGYTNDAQQLAVDYGTLVEGVKGEDNPVTLNVVSSLQLFCDTLWEEYQQLERGESLTHLQLSNNALQELKDCVRDNVIDRREVLILTIGPKEYKSLAPIYEEESKKEDTDVYIVPLPLMKKDIYGNIELSDEEIMKAVHIDEYPSGIDYSDWITYDISIHCPDVIYIQNPYDGTNPCHSVPAAFYANSLRNYSEKIVFVPTFSTAEFDKEDEPDQYNLRQYVNSPGVVYADEVIVQSENIKEQYLNSLIAFAGEDTRAYWNDKIKVREGSFDVGEVGDNAKRILYCIGENELAEHGDIFFTSVKDRIELLKETAGELDVSITLYPNDRNEWNKIDCDTSNQLFDIIDDVVKLEHFSMLDVQPLEADDVAANHTAYYGSPSPFVPAFVVQKKPVMLADYTIEY